MNDLISRQDVLDVITASINQYGGRYTTDQLNMWGLFTQMIKELPSADRPTGKWWIREYEFFTCSECGDDYWNGCDCTEEAEERLRNGDYPKFCSNCGVRMEV